MNNTETYYTNQTSHSIHNLLSFGLSIDCVVFGYHNGEVKVLLVERDIEPFKGSWALTGDLVSPSVDLTKAASEVLSSLTGLKNIFLEQFTTFGSIDRHPAGRVVTVGYFSLVKSTAQEPLALSWAKSSKWFNINNLPNLAFDHREILDKGLEILKRGVRYRPVGFELLPNKFTLLELQDLYEALLGCSFDKPNFRKKILGMDLLVPLNEVESNVAHRPAKLFKFDRERYLHLQKEGLVFDI